MRLQEILEPEDLTPMLAKQLEKSGLFKDLDTHRSTIIFTSKNGVDGSVRVIGDRTLLMHIEGGDQSIDMGSFETAADIIEVIEDIDRNKDAWMKEYDPTYRG